MTTLKGFNFIEKVETLLGQNRGAGSTALTDRLEYSSVKTMTSSAGKTLKLKQLFDCKVLTLYLNVGWKKSSSYMEIPHLLSPDCVTKLRMKLETAFFKIRFIFLVFPGFTVEFCLLLVF